MLAVRGLMSRGHRVRETSRVADREVEAVKDVGRHLTAVGNRHRCRW
jgi:hypothetical protein